MKRLWALIVALVVGWLAFGAPTSVAAEPPTGILAYAYNSSHAPDADAVSHDERGPPEASAARAIHNAVDRRSNGASTCPCDLTTRAPYDYDAPRPHERGASTTADTQVVVTADLRRPHPAGVAAETGGAAAETGIASALTASEQRSVASLQRQIAAHTEKLEAYRADPDAFDNLGYLERAPSLEIRQQIIDGRINHLETEIRGFQDQIDKLLGGG